MERNAVSSFGLHVLNRCWITIVPDLKVSCGSFFWDPCVSLRNNYIDALRENSFSRSMTEGKHTQYSVASTGRIARKEVAPLGERGTRMNCRSKPYLGNQVRHSSRRRFLVTPLQLNPRSWLAGFMAGKLACLDRKWFSCKAWLLDIQPLLYLTQQPWVTNCFLKIYTWDVHPKYIEEIHQIFFYLRHLFRSRRSNDVVRLFTNFFFNSLVLEAGETVKSE